MYISEVAPANWRGFLGCIPELNAVIGTAIVYAFGAIPFEDDSCNSLSYYYLALIAFSIILLAEILLLTVKESPNTPNTCLLYTSPSPRDRQKSRMPSSA